MLCNGKEFEGTVDYAFTDMRLQLRTGRNDTTCISQFVPAVFPNAQTRFKQAPLVLFLDWDVCSVCGGTAGLARWSNSDCCLGWL